MSWDWAVAWVGAGNIVGLEEVANGIWAVYFGPVSLGWLHVRKGAILDSDGSYSRNPKL